MMMNIMLSRGADTAEEWGVGGGGWRHSFRVSRFRVSVSMQPHATHSCSSKGTRCAFFLNVPFLHYSTNTTKNFNNKVLSCLELLESPNWFLLEVS